jgi:parallel beta-helix repeat protein
MHRHTLLMRLSLVTGLALICSGVTAGSGAAAVGPQPHCGSVLTRSIVLTRDLTGCPSNGLVIGADDVTLDLNGHTVDGDGTLQDPCPGDQPCDVGIDNSAGHARVTIRDGSIGDFAVGVLVVGAQQNDLRQLSVAGSFFAGIVVVNSSGTRVTSSTVTDNGLTTDSAGIVLFTSQDNRIQANRLSGNGDAGLFAGQADNNLIADNTVGDNTNAGIVLDGSGNDVSRNRVARNGDGIIVTGDGNRIRKNQVQDAVGCSDGGCGFGISLEGGTGNTISGNDVLRANKVAIRVDAFTGSAADTVIRGNLVRGAGVHGIAVDFEHVGPVTDTLVVANIALRAGDDGIHVDSASTTITRNTAVNNTDLGIDAVPGITDGGGNRAAHNGNPLECVNLVCQS